MKQDDFLKLKEKIGYEYDIMEREEYFNSAVIILLTKINDEYCIILEKRCESIRQGGEICFPGGKIEPGESAEAAALRETFEELGISSEKIEIIGKLPLLVAPMGATLDTYIGITNVEQSDLIINSEEVEEALFVPLSFFHNNKPDKYTVLLKIFPEFINENDEKIVLFPAKDLNLPERYWNSWGNYNYNVYVYNYNNVLIWGMTAKIIASFIDRLKK